MYDNSKQYKDAAENMLRNIYDASIRTGRHDAQVDERFFVALSLISVYLKDENYLEACNSISDIMCYDLSSEEAQFLLERTLCKIREAGYDV